MAEAAGTFVETVVLPGLTGLVVLFWDGAGLCVVGPFPHETPAQQWVRAVGAAIGTATVVRCMDPTDWDV